MSGLAQHVTRHDRGRGYRPRVPGEWLCVGEGEPAPAENLSIGVIVSRNFEDTEYAKDTIKRGMEKHPDAVWVRADTDRIVSHIYTELGIDPVVIPLLPYFKGETFDVRRVWRDTEMLLCDHLLVFQKEGSSGEWKERAARGVHDCLHLIEHGAEKKKARKGRKVE